MSITLRSEKGAALTHTEMDTNFKSFLYSGSYNSGSQEVLLYLYPSSSLGFTIQTGSIVPPELSVTTSVTGAFVDISTGTGSIFPVATSGSAGLLEPGDKIKLEFITGSNSGDETTSSILNKIGDGSLISSTYLPSYVDDVLEFANFNALPVTGEQGKIYVTVDNNSTYRWTGSAYTAISNPLDYASQLEAEANTENTKVMTALRVFQNWLKNVTDYVHASLPTTSKTILGAISELFTSKLDKNGAITGATKTKVTYDSKGLVTSGADATTADIQDSANKRYQTDNQNTFNDATSSIQTQLNNLGVAQGAITTAVSITTATTTDAGNTQNGRNILIKNGSNAINLTCNGGVTTTYQKGVGSTGAITFIQGSGRTLVQVSGTAILNGVAGSIASLTSDGTTDYLIINNF